jgi:hypothetical protein
MYDPERVEGREYEYEETSERSDSDEEDQGDDQGDDQEEEERLKKPLPTVIK